MTPTKYLAIAVLFATPTFAACPNVGLGETALDCPWADIARDLDAVKSDANQLENLLETRTPEIVMQADLDSLQDEVKLLWGRSVNFDEGAKGIIVDPEIVDAIAQHFLPTFAATTVDGREIVHAGMEHTYGYVFSILKTPYGYKRARWVAGEIENGLGLPLGALSPTPEFGTLFANVSYLIGHIALRNDVDALATLESNLIVDPSLEDFDFTALKVTHLEEILTIPTVAGPPRVITIHTDYVPFIHASGGLNTNLLVYSLQENAGEPFKLISAFPVNDASVNQAIAPASLGNNVPVQLRNNAFTEDIYGKKFSGTRRLIP